MLVMIFTNKEKILRLDYFKYEYYLEKKGKIIILQEKIDLLFPHLDITNFEELKRSLENSQHR